MCKGKKYDHKALASGTLDAQSATDRDANLNFTQTLLRQLNNFFPFLVSDENLCSHMMALGNELSPFLESFGCLRKLGHIAHSRQ